MTASERRQLKTNARALLRGHRPQSIAYVLLEGLLIAGLCLFGMFLHEVLALFPQTAPTKDSFWRLVPSVVAIGLSVPILSAFRFGRFAWYTRRATGLPADGLFEGTSGIRAAILHGSYDSLLRMVIALPALALLTITKTRIMLEFRYQLVQLSETLLWHTLWTVGFVICALCWFWLIQRLSCAPGPVMFAQKDDPDRRYTFRMLRRTLRLTKGRQNELLLLKLSFWPWFLACLLLFPILYVKPYYEQAIALYHLQHTSNH